MTSRFSLRVRLTDGFTFDLAESYGEQWRAERAASQYMADYSDPCGLGVRVETVSILDAALAE